MAVLLLTAYRRRRRAAAEPELLTLISAATPRYAGRGSKSPVGRLALPIKPWMARAASSYGVAGTPRDNGSAAWHVPIYSASVRLPWALRAALAIQLGRPAELRRIAVEMMGAGYDMEAGLLENYAVLFERSRRSRGRVLAEVTRMLQAAAAHRRGAPDVAIPARSPLYPRHAAPPSPAELARPEERARASRPLVSTQVLPLGARRRAVR